MDIMQKSILVIDDNFVNQKLLRVLLTADGYNVKTAYDATSAMDVLKIFVPDLILMDLQLPNMDGLELTKIIKKQYKNINIIAVTAFAMKGDEEKALNGGCDGYISKPIDIDKFTQSIEFYLGLNEHNIVQL